MSATQENEKMIFETALELKTDAERTTYLDKVCGFNLTLKARIMALLQARDGGGDYLETLMKDPGFSVEENVLEKPGTIIGRYKLLEKIGEGGMAVVYMAEQTELIHRKVALKIIKLGMDTKSVIARFEAERQALGMMDHPNIAKVHDAGATETGRPYFVMELVIGVSITEYCDKNNLSTKDRLALFIQVCSAVQHAHQKGIIHRDIKPTNVMVARHEGTPIPKVIDFGIAKATNQRLTEKTLFTRYAHIVGTPAYMSPEQAELNDIDIDTRSDIYSLGVLLYELLTGTTPFSEEELRKAGYAEMTRIIREQEPPRPSTRITQMQAANKSAIRNLKSAIANDLDWIVMKSLEKERSRRYETPTALGMDVQRYLASEPILARGPSTMYQLQKFLKRNQLRVVTVLTTVAAIIAVGIIFSMGNQLANVKSVEDHAVLEEARTALANRDYSAALEHLESIRDSKHVGSQAQFLYAGILVEDRQPEDAITMLEELLDDQPEIAGAAHALLARILWENKTLDPETLSDIDEHKQKAEALLAETAEAHYLRAMTASTIKEQFTSLDRALQLDPGHYESYRLRAFTYYASRKYEDMEDDATAMIALAPRDSLGYSLRAMARHQLGQYARAIRDYDSAIKLAVTEDPQYVDLSARRCDALMAMGQYDRVIDDARQGLDVAKDALPLEFRIFCVLTARGRFEEASTLFNQVAKADPASRHRFRDLSMKHVSDTLEAGRSWHPPGRDPAGIAFLAMHEAEEIYQYLSARGATRLIGDGFAADWHPEGKKLAFSVGVRDTSGLAIFDPASRETELLIVPGRDPKWSPNGRYIAFVRDRPALSLQELTAAERRYRYRYPPIQEVWIVAADGTDPRRLADGVWPSWSQDSKQVYYRKKSIRVVSSISIEDREAQPQEILKGGGDGPRVSPDAKYVAYASNGSLKMADIASGSHVVLCEVPPKLWGRAWAPGGRQFAMVGSSDPESTTGLWIYDLDKEQAAKILAGPITNASWTSDETLFALSLGPPFREVWTADLDPNGSTIDALGPGRTKEEYYQDTVRHYSRIIEADPDDAESYFRRAKYYHCLYDKEQYIADMNKYVGLLYPAEATNLHSTGFLDFLNRLWRGTLSNLGPPMNSRAQDGLGGTGCMSADGLSLYMNPGSEGLGFDICLTTRARRSDPWRAPVILGSPVNTPSSEITPSLTADGLSLFFCSDRPDGYGNYDIWVSRRATTKDDWGTPVNLGPPVNTKEPEWSLSISPDGLTLYFAAGDYFSSRSGGQGGFDIWVTTRATTDNAWGVPENLGPTINSIGDDSVPTLSTDGLLLFYSSERTGGYGGNDILVTRRTSTADPWGEPVNLGAPVNTAFWEQSLTISPDGSTVYFSSTQPRGQGGEDIWQVSIAPKSGVFQLDSHDELDQKKKRSNNTEED